MYHCTVPDFTHLYHVPYHSLTNFALVRDNHRQMQNTLNNCEKPFETLGYLFHNLSTPAVGPQWNEVATRHRGIEDTVLDNDLVSSY